MRPALARTSSAASGLRFCGMIEEPVVKRSESLTKPNCGVAPEHDLLGEAREMHGADRGGGERLQREVAVGDGVERVRRRPVEAERRRRSRAGRSGRPCRRAPRRRAGTRSAAAGIGEAAAVARKHLDIGEQVMAEGDRLGALQMREARHHGVGMRLGLRRERRLAGACSWRVDRRRSASRTQRRKSVATWSLRERAVCSRPAASPISSASRAFDVHVDVFERARKGEAALGDLRRDRVQARDDLRRRPRAEMMP